MSPRKRATPAQHPSRAGRRIDRSTPPIPRPRHDLPPQDLYRIEKDRRAQLALDPSTDPLADAKREYKALLAAEALRGKGGRPRKTASPPTGAKRAAEPDDEAADAADESDAQADGESHAPDEERDDD